MTYGTMHEPTRTHLWKRAKESGLDPAEMLVEPCRAYPPYEDADGSLYCCVKPADHTEGRTLDVRRHRWTLLAEVTNLYTFTVTCDGALEEEFNLLTMYEVNICDWIAETLVEDADHGDIEDWEVSVAPYSWSSENPAEIKYRVSSGDVESHDYEPGEATHPMHTDPLCRICGEPRSRHKNG